MHGQASLTRARWEREGGREGKGKGKVFHARPAYFLFAKIRQDKREKRCWFRTLEDDQVTKARTRRPSKLVLYRKEEGEEGKEGVSKPAHTKQLSH